MSLFVRSSIVVGVLIVLIGGFFVLRNWNKQLPLEIQPQSAPEFTLKDYQGQEVKLSDFRGKAVIVNAWATWCPFCKEELIDFAALQKEYGDKIAVIAVDRAESLEISKKYSDDLKVTGSLIFLLDQSDSFYQAIGGFSMPETIFVDKNGFIRDHKRGPMKLEEMKRRVNKSFEL